MAEKIRNRNYDLSSNPMGRVFRHFLLSRMIPLGCYQRGGGLKCLLVLWVSTVLGRPLYYLAARFERTVARLRRLRAILPFVWRS